MNTMTTMFGHLVQGSCREVAGAPVHTCMCTCTITLYFNFVLIPDL